MRLSLGPVSARARRLARIYASRSGGAGGALARVLEQTPFSSSDRSVDPQSADLSTRFLKTAFGTLRSSGRMAWTAPVNRRFADHDENECVRGARS